MQLRQIGRSILKIAPVVLGGNVFGWTVNEERAFAILDAFVEADGNCIDTADVYPPRHSGGESETLIGNWLKSRGLRDRVVIATKVGMRRGGIPGLSREHILSSVEGSLRRLRTDVIDLYQAHTDDTETPLEETLQAFDELVRQGKVRAIGASNYSAARLAEALRVSKEHDYARYECLQPHYNLLERSSFDREVASLVREQELGVITYSALASGFLTGKYQPNQPLPMSPRAPGVQESYMNARGFAVLKEVEQVAKSHEVLPPQVALAWLIARPGVTAPIASATSVDQVHMLLGAVNLHLSGEEMAALNAVGE
jgi:aryl-alcohol dehydrogenase-like predicted oxidoreductase